MPGLFMHGIVVVGGRCSKELQPACYLNDTERGLLVNAVGQRFSFRVPPARLARTECFYDDVLSLCMINTYPDFRKHILSVS